MSTNFSLTDRTSVFITSVPLYCHQFLLKLKNAALEAVLVQNTALELSLHEVYSD